jgi:hypothetical protein
MRLGNRSNTHNIKIRCWNINGLSSDKLDDVMFNNVVSSVDICCFVETFQTNFETRINNNYTYCKNATKLSKRGRAMGGTMKNTIREGIKIIQSTCNQIVWLELNKNYFGLDRTLYMCRVYSTCRV